MQALLGAADSLEKQLALKKQEWETEREEMQHQMQTLQEDSKKYLDALIKHSKGQDIWLMLHEMK